MEKVKFIDYFSDITKDAKKIPTGKYLDFGLYPIYDQGQNDIAGYINDREGIFENIPAIIFGDHTRIVKYVDKACFIGADGVKLLKPKRINDNCKYLYYCLSNLRIPNTGYNRHFKWLKESQINLVPKAFQDKIVIQLDTIKKIIELRKNELNQLDLLIKARFVEMFGNPVINNKNWNLKTLNAVGTIGRGVSKHRPRNAPELLGGKYPLVQTGDIANSQLFLKEYHQTYSEIGLKQSKLWEKGTLCITIAANIAKTAILSFDACFPDSIVGFIPNSQINNIFVYFWFSFFQQILEAQAPASAQKNINLEILSKLKIIVPPIELQNQFKDFVQQVDKSKVAVQKSLDEAQLLYDSLMQKYFD